ncbi:hypothetical protein HPT25_27860 [Bacillus sp. BRMEA1]|uniref:hypothetical protein n=1 Tax=Neobacillus endophyticus TaxID=2738405 RepID=UPI00156721CE|nr:hypothetical protein [Neobacillus endophyticus]NRD81111.1 hypothetical protein [Neobacillus endophyticus]
MLKLVKCLLGVSIGSTIFLAGCSQDAFSKKANDEINRNKMAVDKRKEEQEKSKDDANKIYKKLEKPISEDIKEIDKDKRTEQNISNIPMKDTYSDPNEMALRISKEIFDFSTGKTDVNQYYDFLMKYGSKTFIQEFLPNEEKGKSFLTNVQEAIKSQKGYGIKYTITTVDLNKAEDEGNFYRKVTLNTNEEAYFITTIVNENGSWKFSEDNPSPPYQEIGGNNNDSTNTGN